MTRSRERQAMDRLDLLAEIGRPDGDGEAAAIFDEMFCETTWALGVDVPLDELLAGAR